LVFEFTIYALANRLRASWMEVMVTKAARVSARVLEVLGEPPVASEPGESAPNQRRGRTTKPLLSSLRLTISMRTYGTFATAASTCHTL